MTELTLTPGPNIPNPRELMRARHPDLFSDTEVDHQTRLSKAVFEYHLDTLTSRKQEYQFEHFCRKLAEKVICPNLRVQAGPTGGGDSKVDSETYPVAPEIAERWWVGEPAAGSERWAFAFSAKKAWKAKVKADVDNILSTGRDYKRIYFFTNQFVSDKDRANTEDKLSGHAGIPVHIIDRAWLVDTVYEKDHLEMAVDTLEIDGAGSEVRRKPGPRDTARLQELEELDREVADPARYEGARYQLVEDCLQAALLARGLERSRNEVEARFTQTDRLAQELGLASQRLRVAYNRAWTAYWWYEDYASFQRFYDEVEEHVAGAVQAVEIERLLTLWQLLTPAVAAKRIDAGTAKIEQRAATLVSMFEVVAADDSRPNNALQARTGLALMGLTQAFQVKDAGSLAAVCTELSTIVDDAAQLGAYPLERLSDIVQELGQRIDTAEFDALFEKVVDSIRARRSEGEAGAAYTQRAAQKLKQGKPYEAIRWFGRAEELLIKDEYRGDLVMSLLGSSYAFERVGLLWAARIKVLAAAERSLAVLLEDGEIIGPALLALQRLVWIELQIGRIPQALTAMSMAAFVVAHLKLAGDRLAAHREEVEMQEAVIGIHMLNTPYDELAGITQVPDLFEHQGLTNARLAALFALGHEEQLRAEGYFPPSLTPEELLEFFERWQDQPAAADIPRVPIYSEGARIALQSRILGIEIVVEAPNETTSLGISESLIGALEAFLATSDEDNLFPHLERLTITVAADQGMSGVPVLRFPDGNTAAELAHPTTLSFASADEILAFVQWLQLAVVELIPRLFVIRDAAAWMDKVAGQERAFGRAINFGDALTLSRNIFGEEPKLRLADWADPADNTYAVKRDKVWRVRALPPERDQSEPPAFAEGPPPANLTDKEQLRHNQRRVLSPIDIPLWDRAKWSGVAFAQFESRPPILGLAYRDGEAGQQIFRGWRERWGKEDVDDALKVTIIRGVSASNPHHYAVVISPNINQLRAMDANTVTTFVSRINRMEPTNSANLNGFLAAYGASGGFMLTPAKMGAEPEFVFELLLAKRTLHVRQAWQIGANDPDASALRLDDDPIIPPMVVDPPVRQALAQLRQFRSRPR